VDKVTYIFSSITSSDWHSSISVKIGEGRLGEKEGKKQERERKVKEDKAEDIDFNI
jgi:hypothetical protein